MTDALEPGELAVLAVLLAALATVFDEDELEAAGVSMNSRFVEDLDLESIDLVRIASVLRNQYGDRIDLPAWFATLGLDDIADLTVGDVVRHIVGCLR